MEEMDRKMDETLEKRVADLHAHDDESGDGQITAADMKLQLDRLEAQLELQDQQNRALLKGQRTRLILTCVLGLVLLVLVGYLWFQVNQAYNNILQTSAQVNELATQVQTSLDTLDAGELEAMLGNLPEISEKLSKIDVDALNEVLTRMPALMDTVTDLKTGIEGLQQAMGAFSGLSGLSGLGNLFGLGGN